jgi:transcriptional regulator with XRE-family HTH domain
MSEIDDLLGIEEADELDALASELVSADLAWVTQLVARRKQLGLTQADVARAMGRSQSVVSDIETMSSDPRLSTLRRYALAIGAAVKHRVFQKAGTSPLVRGPSGPITARSVSAGSTRSTRAGDIFVATSSPSKVRKR